MLEIILWSKIYFVHKKIELTFSYREFRVGKKTPKITLIIWVNFVSNFIITVSKKNAISTLTNLVSILELARQIADWMFSETPLAGHSKLNFLFL